MWFPFYVIGSARQARRMGQPLLGDASEDQTLNEVWRTEGLAIGSEGCHCLVVAFVGLEDRVEPGAVKQFSHSLIGANQFDLTVLLSG
jgi:hypothetical protein